MSEKKASAYPAVLYGCYESGKITQHKRFPHKFLVLTGLLLITLTAAEAVINKGGQCPEN